MGELEKKGRQFAQRIDLCFFFLYMYDKKLITSNDCKKQYSAFCTEKQVDFFAELCNHIQ